MRLPGPRRLLLLGVTVFAVAVPLGGGGTYVAMELTTKPQFCNSCHIMEPYYESWRTSTHSNVPCVDCHYEPGLLETFEGKFKALSQLAKYVTATEGTKPWAEVSDYSCLRSGCHSTRVLEGDIQFGRIRFDHRNHLIGLRRGKQLRCTSCHSQIVQGEHLTVTPRTCILCHFKDSPDTKPVNDCNRCHGPPEEAIELGGFTFRHSEYLKRGVECNSCHGDVTRGTGGVPKRRCGSCHNVQAHLDRYEDTDFIHKHHVADHSVNCFECHDVIEHSLPPREEHYSGACSDCHESSHGAMTSLYRGTGGKDVADRPGIMFLARVTCNGCHKPPFEGAPAPQGGATYKADPLSCVDCHGTGFLGMAERWQKELNGHLKKVEEALEELREMLTEEWEDGDMEAARRSYEQAAYNYGLVLLDKSGGVHNLPYARDLLRQAMTDIGKATVHLDPEETAPRVSIGPATASEQDCTTLCHTGVEAMPVNRAFDLPFAHAKHFGSARMDCSKCHEAEPHGTTRIKQADCISCHHQQEEPGACASCHTDIGRLRSQQIEGANMADLDCLSCHETLADGHSQEAIRGSCQECHTDDGADYGTKKFDVWRAAATAPLDELEKKLAGAPPEVAARIKKELDALRAAGPFHNAAFIQAEAKRLAAELAK